LFLSSSFDDSDNISNVKKIELIIVYYYYYWMFFFDSSKAL